MKKTTQFRRLIEAEEILIQPGRPAVLRSSRPWGFSPWIAMEPGADEG